MGDAMSQSAVLDKIRRILIDEGLQASLLEDGFQVPYESTAINITVEEQTDRTVIRLAVPLLREVQASPELFRWSAVEGQQYLFGSVTVVEMPDGTFLLLFDHTLLGDYLDRPELMGALGALATTGNDLDDELQTKFGGKRFIDS